MIDALWLTLRAAGYVLILQAAGWGVFLALFVRQLSAAIVPRLWDSAARAAQVALALLLTQGLLEPWHLGGSWESAGEPALWRLAFLSAGALSFWMRLAGLAALAVATRRGRALRPLAPAGALVTLASFLATGHTSHGPQRLLLGALLGLHLVAVAFWFGSLAGLRALFKVAPAVAVLPVLREFSRCALWLVPLLALAGVLLALRLLPDLAALRAPYGRLLCLKALLFVILMLLAALNRLRFVPALARGASPAALMRTIAAEYWLIAAVLVATAAMTGLYSPADTSP
jgi:copper resistance protein D